MLITCTANPVPRVQIPPSPLLMTDEVAELLERLAVEETPRARSSTDQSTRLRIWGLQVRILSGALESLRFFAGRGVFAGRRRVFATARSARRRSAAACVSRKSLVAWAVSRRGVRRVVVLYAPTISTNRGVHMLRGVLLSVAAGTLAATVVFAGSGEQPAADCDEVPAECLPPGGAFRIVERVFH